ncbi:hypothetical protein GN956_G23484 [Arapaima gigas]
MERLDLCDRRRRDTQTVEKDTPRETQFTEDEYYSTFTECNVSETRNQTQDVSSQEDEGSYTAVQFNTKRPAKTSAPSDPDRHDGFIYSSVATDSRLQPDSQHEVTRHPPPTAASLLT